MKKFKGLQSSSNIFEESDSIVKLNAMSEGAKTSTDRSTKYWNEIKDEKEESRKKGYGLAIKYNNKTDFNPHLRENYDLLYFDIDGTAKPNYFVPNKKKEG